VKGKLEDLVSNSWHESQKVNPKGGNRNSSSWKGERFLGIRVQVVGKPTRGPKQGVRDQLDGGNGDIKDRGMITREGIEKKRGKVKLRKGGGHWVFV